MDNCLKDLGKTSIKDEDQSGLDEYNNALMTSLLMLGTTHPHRTHAMGSLTAEIRGSNLCLMLGFEHRQLRLITVMIGEGGNMYH